MATEITMPKLSDTMTEGRLISWKKSVGEKVERGDILAEVETDKANMELEAFTSGVLLETRVKPGEMAPVGTVIAIVGEAGETAPTPQKEEVMSPPEPEKEQPEPVSEKKVKEALPEPETTAGEPAAGAPAETEKASPMVRRLARERGIDLKLVTGSGPDGRILQEDLEKQVKVEEEKQVKVEVQVDGKAPKPETVKLLCRRASPAPVADARRHCPDRQPGVGRDSPFQRDSCHRHGRGGGGPPGTEGIGYAPDHQ